MIQHDPAEAYAAQAALFAAPEPDYRAVEAFRSIIYGYFTRFGRDFPWRRTTAPFHVIVSEIMLQQTQTERVAQRFPEFVARFPGFEALAAAPLQAVLAAWQGLGYNRRAKSLHHLAQVVVTKLGGTLPRTVAELRELPGLGPATAASVAAFAFNAPVAFIETNVRTVFLYFFFHDRTGINDRSILPLVELTLDRDNPRAWYNALMDYGVLLKKSHPNTSRRSAHYSKQAPLRGSNREVRGAILKLLLDQGELSAERLLESLGFAPERTLKALAELVREGFLSCDADRYRVP